MPDDAPIQERVPPNNIGAERAVLGSMMLNGEAAALGIEEIKEEHFYTTRHRYVFSAIKSIYDEDGIIDEITVCDQLKKDGLLVRCGGHEYVSKIAEGTPLAANIGRYINIVKQQSLGRSLISHATEILRDVDDARDSDEVLEEAENKMFKLRSGRSGSDIARLDSVLDSQYEMIRDRSENPGKLTGLQIGFRRIDQMTHGFQDSELLILAARPSVGKSAMAMCIMDYVTNRIDKSCLLFTLEMSRDQVGMRLLSSHCHIPHRNLMTGSLSESEWESLSDHGMGKLRSAPIFIDDSPVTSSQIRAKARRLKSTNDIGLVVIDYLQLIKADRTKSRDSREREVAKISALLKELARELKVPVLALSQLNRAADDKNGGKPGLASLRESGALEQDADVVMLMHRAKNENGSWNHNTVLEIAKQRNGPTGKMEFIFQPQFMSFIPKLAVV
jgi:replicative DNA helicase